MHTVPPHVNDPDDAFLDEQKTLLAERYGGRGVGSNGGGVRCGLDGEIQIKGTGRNGLLGKHSDFNHSNGGASLEEAVREALWGEVCALTMPYGGARVYGILGTGTKTYFQGPGAVGGMVDRALILRQPVLRPAHYMRAIDCDLSDTSLNPPGFDAERTTAAIQEFDLGLASVLGRRPSARQDANFINEGLVEMARRFAVQVAAGHVKRMPHGALNCSNIALDGRLVDFGTMTSISDYGRVIVVKEHADLWEAHSPFYSTFVNLLFYLRNYLPPAAGQQILAAEDMVKFFRSSYDARLTVEYLKLTGIPEEDLVRLEHPLLADMANCITQIISRGNKEPFQMPQMPEKTGAFHLNSIFMVASLSCDKEMPTAIEPLLNDDELLKSFVRSYTRLRRAYLANIHGAPRDSASLLVALNSYRLNSPLMELCRNNLEPSILRLLAERDGSAHISAFITPLLEKAVAVRAELGSEGVDLEWFCGRPVRLLASGATDVNGTRLSCDKVISLLSTDYFSQQQKQMLSTLCKQNF